MTIQPPGKTTVSRVFESYPLRMRSLFQLPRARAEGLLQLPAGVEQSLVRNTWVTVNGVQTFASALETPSTRRRASSRTNGVTTASGGRDSEDYVASDSTGACYHYKLVASQGWVTSDRLVPSC